MLVELLIAMTVLATAILSLVGGYTSGYLALNRSSRTDNAAALADKQMQTYRAGTWSQISSYSNSSAVGADGRTYNLQATVTTQNAPGTSRPVKYVSITVSDSSGHVWASEQSAFDQLNG
jgi:type II secretory pathway pseudopilin PulG